MVARRSAALATVFVLALAGPVRGVAQVAEPTLHPPGPRPALGAAWSQRCSAGGCDRRGAGARPHR